MSKKNIDDNVESRVCFEQLEEWVREQIDQRQLEFPVDDN